MSCYQYNPNRRKNNIAAPLPAVRTQIFRDYFRRAAGIEGLDIRSISDYLKSSFHFRKNLPEKRRAALHACRPPPAAAIRKRGK